jgi:hypothetical protein
MLKKVLKKKMKNVSLFTKPVLVEEGTVKEQTIEMLHRY